MNKKKTYPAERIQLWKDMYDSGDSFTAIHYYENGRGRMTSAEQIKRILIAEGVEMRTRDEQIKIERERKSYNAAKYVRSEA